ncbi:MAG: oligosaccharide flippase family protein, partial [Acidobacteria bacterium]|nr:oligosaccharide flippase family protein [Acidobacteriota bacterium]
MNKSLLRSVLSLLTGTAFANLIAALGTPILTRLYSPEAFGVFAIYTGIVAIAAVLAGWRYDVGIVLPEDDRGARLLLVVSLLLALVSSVALAVLLLAVREPLSRLADAPLLANWILLAPLHVFIAAAYAAFSYWATRTGDFKRIAQTRVLQSAGSLVTRIGMALLQSASFAGLVLGQFIADSAATLLITRPAWPALRSQAARLLPDFSEMKHIALEHRSLAIHAISTTFLNSTATFLLPFLIVYFFDAFSAGLVMMAHRAISMPFLMVTTSLWQVAHAQLARYSDEERAILFSKIHRVSSLVYAFPLTFVVLFPEIVVIVFG